MKPYTLTIRFRETDEYEAEVGTFMRDLSKHTDKSKNRFIIDLIGDYMKRSEQEQQEEAIIEKLRKMIREELQGFAVAKLDSKANLIYVNPIAESTATYAKNAYYQE